MAQFVKPQEVAGIAHATGKGKPASPPLPFYSTRTVSNSASVAGRSEGLASVCSRRDQAIEPGRQEDQIAARLGGHPVGVRRAGGHEDRGCRGASTSRSAKRNRSDPSSTCQASSSERWMCSQEGPDSVHSCTTSEVPTAAIVGAPGPATIGPDGAWFLPVAMGIFLPPFGARARPDSRACLTAPRG
jgi:hypothetical protein